MLSLSRKEILSIFGHPERLRSKFKENSFCDYLFFKKINVSMTLKTRIVKNVVYYNGLYEYIIKTNLKVYYTKLLIV
jgi:hypothetical protein